jgi:hypothetical protein
VSIGTITLFSLNKGRYYLVTDKIVGVQKDPGKQEPGAGKQRKFLRSQLKIRK